MTSARLTIPAVAILAAAALAGCSGEDPGNTTDADTDPENLTTVAEGLEAPWSIGFLGDTALISERDSARILELESDGGTREVGTVDGVEAGGEGGLLGIAVYEDEFLYTYSTGSEGNRIQRHELRGEPGSLRLGGTETILDELPSAGNHNGGRIAFGPDGMLYATVGDAGEPDTAQDLESMSGKILRMTPEGESPEGNPFPDSLVYSYGHRNPQGLAWTDDDTLYASEFGQNTWDELNVIEPGGNYGWPRVEGKDSEGSGEYIDPVQQWEPSEASPSGIAIAGGTLYMANLRGERLFAIPLDDPTTATAHFTGDLGRLRDAVAAPDGTLWIVTNNTDGRGEPRDGDDKVLGFDLG